MKKMNIAGIIAAMTIAASIKRKQTPSGQEDTT